STTTQTSFAWARDFSLPNTQLRSSALGWTPLSRAIAAISTGSKKSRSWKGSKMPGDRRFNSDLKIADPDVFAAIGREETREESGLELIASENYASRAVMQAQGSVLTNKYAEGYPGKRYYGGCEFVDQVEELAIQRICKLFGA